MKTFFTKFLFLASVILASVLSPSIANCQIPQTVLGWKFSSDRIYSATLLVDSSLYIGDMAGKFSKLDANTGKEIWSYKAEDYVASNATFKNGIVIFEAGDRLHGLNAQTGTILWSFKSTDKKPTPGFDTGYHHSSPVIEGNTAYFGDEWGNLNGVDIATGKLDFQYSIPFKYDTLSDYNIRSKPVIQDSIIYFGDYQGYIYAISLKDKSEKWIRKMETPRWDGSIVSEMVIDNNVLYFGRYTNAFIPVDLETGTPLWKFSDPETFLPSTPVFYKNDVIIGTTISSNRIYGINKTTGEKHWELKVKGIFFVKPIIIQDSILVINSTDPFSDKWGMLYFINLEKGEIINEIHLENATESHPVLYNNLIIIGKSDGLYAFDYKPLLKKPGISEFSFDNSPDTITIKSNEKLLLSYPLINSGDFCDTINVSFEKTGRESIKNITLTERKNYHVRPTQKTDISIKAKENTLQPGEYTIKTTIRSARQAINPLFEKTITLKVEAPTSSNNFKPTNFKWVTTPNPFKTKVSFSVGSFPLSDINLTIFSIDGAVVFSERYCGAYEKDKIEWNGCDESGIPVTSGVYIYQISTKELTTSGKLIKNP
jgi:outer membrane protein assembly factor BamB